MINLHLRKRRRSFRFSPIAAAKGRVKDEGLIDYLLDGQTFDIEGVRSMREHPRHVDTSPFTSYNYHGKGNFAGLVDIVHLGATEVDVNFNANVVTHSGGVLLHGK